MKVKFEWDDGAVVLVSNGKQAQAGIGEVGILGWVQLELGNEQSFKALNFTKAQARSIGSALMGAAAEL